jgi:Tol biopolymer transport system component
VRYRTIALACAAGLATVAAAGPTPTIFAPGVISGPAHDGSPSFMPDGKTLFFTRSGSSAGTIMESHLVDGHWTTPEIAPFSGQWNDQHAAVAPDGSYLIFVSTRPVTGITERVAHIWRTDRTASGWTTPQHLSAAVNLGPRIFAPSIAADGTIYFLSIGTSHAFQLYRSRSVRGVMQPAEKLSFSSPATMDVDPEIAPDQSFLVFASAGRRTKDDPKEHLYMVRDNHGTWGPVTPIRYDGDDANGSSSDNEPSLNHAGDTLYFSSDRTLPPVLPRTMAQAQEDLKRIETWDNGNTNVWYIPMPTPAPA